MCFKADGVLTMSVVSCSEEHGCSESGIGGAYVVAGGKLKLNYNDVYRDVSCDVLIQPNQAFKISNCAEPQVGLAVPSRSFYRPTIGELK